MLNPIVHPHYLKVKELAIKEGSEVVPISAKIEEELSDLSKEEKLEFLNDLGININISGLKKDDHHKTKALINGDTMEERNLTN